MAPTPQHRRWAVVALGVLVAASLGVAPVVKGVGLGGAVGLPSGAVLTATRIAARCPDASWPLDRLAAETVVVPVQESDVAAVGPEVAEGVGGVVLFGSSAPSDLPGALRRLTSLAPSGIRPFVMADEEGGAVQRMADLVGNIPSARRMAATMSPAAIEALATAAGRRMLAAGVTMDLAPVLDVDGGVGPNQRDADGTRSFSASEPVAAADGLAFAAGLERAGVVPVVKHFPGLGSSTGNTDLQPAATPPLATLERIGLRPFAAAVRAGIPAVMVSNATVPGLTTVPASISHAVIGGLLRGQLGFEGLVVTDALDAQALDAIGRTVPEAAVAAVASGADLVLFGGAAPVVGRLTGQVIAALTSAVGSGAISTSTLLAAATAVLAAKHVAGCNFGVPTPREAAGR